MLNELILELDDTSLNYRQASLFQGVIMDNINPCYAEILHRPGLNPYAQTIINRGNHCRWVIHTVTDEAYENIIVPLMSEIFQQIHLRKTGKSVQILKKDQRSVSEKELFAEFYEGNAPRYIQLEFQTPTAFKQDGRYINYPDLKLVYNSLMNKCSSVWKHMDMFDKETLEQMSKESRIVRYRLRSVDFPLEGIVIPAFVGEITVKISGPLAMCNYIWLLAKFGEYSGVGIKSAMGMGKMSIRNREMKDEGQ